MNIRNEEIEKLLDRPKITKDTRVLGECGLRIRTKRLAWHSVPDHSSAGMRWRSSAQFVLLFGCAAASVGCDGAAPEAAKPLVSESAKPSGGTKPNSEAKGHDGAPAEPPAKSKSQEDVFERALGALKRDDVGSLSAAIEAFASSASPSSSDEVKGSAFARAFEFREQLVQTAIDEKYTELDGMYLEWFSTDVPSDLSPLSPGDEKMVASLKKAGLVRVEDGELAHAVLTHRPMLRDPKLLVPGARELVESHYFLAVTWPEACAVAEEGGGGSCDPADVVRELDELNRVVDEVESKALRELLVENQRKLGLEVRARGGELGAPSCERSWSDGIAGLEAKETLGSPHPLSDSRALVARLVKGEKPYVWLAVQNAETNSLQALGQLTEMEIEEHAAKFDATFEAIDDRHVGLAFGFTYKDAYDLAGFELTGHEEGCEEWSPGDTLDEPCGPVVEAMYAASKKKNHIVCDVSNTDAVECSQPHGSRKDAMASLLTKSECLALDCCFGKPVE